MATIDPTSPSLHPTTSVTTTTTTITRNKNRKWWPFVVLPFFVGIVWTLLHPVVSVLTGDLKCRNGYIDENSLEPGNLRSESVYSLVRPHSRSSIGDENNMDKKSLCGALMPLSNNRTNLSCHGHQNGLLNLNLDVARLIPTGNTVEPSNEAIVLVVPSPNTNTSWTTSQLHHSLLELLQILSSPQTAPWLAKTLLVVSPTTTEKDVSLYDAVDVFFDSYMGVYDTTVSNRNIVPLPPYISNAMIRNLLVLDIDSMSSSDDQQSPSSSEIRILPHGRRGVLPNMDLVFVTKSVFSQQMMGGAGGRRGTTTQPILQMHSHSYAKQQFAKHLAPSLPPYLETWALSLCDLFLFAHTMLRGPYGAHALALDRGIDALTIQGRYPNSTTSTDTASNRFVTDNIKKLEITIRALSNLHERLHHSTTLYLLPAPGKFIKHEEYLIPNLLLLVPMVVRAATLALKDIRQFQLRVMGWMILITLGATLWMDYLLALTKEDQHDSTTTTTQQNTWLAVTYTACFGLFYDQVLRQQKSSLDGPSAMQSAQLVMCLMGIYVHVPICFGHVSLAYPSAFFWAPWLAFPSYSDWYRSKFLSLISLAWLVVSWPPMVLLPWILPDDSSPPPPYVRFVYFPLHLLLSLSCLLGLVIGGGAPKKKVPPY